MGPDRARGVQLLRPCRTWFQPYALISNTVELVPTFGAHFPEAGTSRTRSSHNSTRIAALNPQRFTLPQSSTLNFQPSTLNPQPSTLNPQPSTLPQPSLNPPRFTLPQPSTLNPQRFTLSQPVNLNPQPSTLQLDEKSRKGEELSKQLLEADREKRSRAPSSNIIWCDLCYLKPWLYAESRIYIPIWSVGSLGIHNRFCWISSENEGEASREYRGTSLIRKRPPPRTAVGP